MRGEVRSRPAPTQHLTPQTRSPPTPGRGTVLLDSCLGSSGVSGATMPQVEMILCLLVLVVVGVCVRGQDPASKVVSDRYAVSWNRTNPK